MAMQPIDAICGACGTHFNAVPRQTFLGFQRLTCPSCKAVVHYPLTPGYRNAYWVLVGLMALAIFNAFSQGGYGFPGGIGLAMIYGLYKDGQIRRDIAARASAAPPAPVQQ